MLISVLFWGMNLDCVRAGESLAHQRHVLSRLTFGATSYELEQVHLRGIEAYIQSQLQPQSIKESPEVGRQLSQLNSVNQESRELQKYATSLRHKLKNLQLGEAGARKIRQKIRRFGNKVVDEAVDAHIARAIYSRRQLQEVMVDFWFNHFNVHSSKGSVKLWINGYENEIRSHALGNFYDLLLATAKHPAMLIYLDNKKNTAPE
ncbi:MAG: DUF1800 family protein, partial [Cyanobacteria bacterium P01_C01_bin.72]